MHKYVLQIPTLLAFITLLISGCQSLPLRTIADNDNASFHALGDVVLHREMREMSAASEVTGQSPIIPLLMTIWVLYYTILVLQKISLARIPQTIFLQVIS